MNKQKSSLTCTLALGLLLGLGTNAQAEEWEQTFTVDLGMHGEVGTFFGHPVWGFSKDSLVEGYSRKYSTWEVNQSCICYVGLGSCSHSLENYEFFEYDQEVWRVASKDGLKEGFALDLSDSSVFEKRYSRDGTSLLDGPYVFENKKNAQIDTNYFVYRKDSAYYVLCQYITVYDSVVSRYEEQQGGIPAYYVHQCIYQNDGTPTFSKIPMYSGDLPKSLLIDPPSTFVRPLRRKVKEDVVNKPYLIDGRSAKGNTSIGIRVEKERVYRQ